MYTTTVNHLRALQSLATTNSLYQLSEYVGQVQNWAAESQDYISALEKNVKTLEKRCEATEAKLDAASAAAEVDPLTRKASASKNKNDKKANGSHGSVLVTMKRPSKMPVAPTNLQQLAPFVNHRPKAVDSMNSVSNARSQEQSIQQVTEEAQKNNRSKPVLIQRKSNAPAKVPSRASSRTPSRISSPTPMSPDNMRVDQKTKSFEPPAVVMLPQTSILKPNLKAEVTPSTIPIQRQPESTIKTSQPSLLSTANPPEKSSVFKPSFLFKKMTGVLSSPSTENIAVKPAPVEALVAPPQDPISATSSPILSNLKLDAAKSSTSALPTTDETTPTRRVFGGRRNQPIDAPAVQAPIALKSDDDLVEEILI